MALVILSSTLLTYFYGREVVRLQRVAAARHRLIADAERLISTVKDAETGQRGFLLTGDENYLQPYSDAVARLPQQLAGLDRPEEPRLPADDIATIRRLIESTLAQMQNSIDVRRTGVFDAAVAAVTNEEAKHVRAELRGVIVNVQTREEIRWRAETEAADHARRQLSALFILCGTTSLLFLAWTYRRISTVLTQREAVGDAKASLRDQLS